MISGFVVDCSALIGFCYEDEYTNYHAVLQERFEATQGYAPDILPVEFGNVLRNGERRGRGTPLESAQSIALLCSMRIQIIQLAQFDKIEPLLNLARQYDLTLYDAQYLYVAMQHEIPLFTLDKGLRTAASKAGVTFV